MFVSKFVNFYYSNSSLSRLQSRTSFGQVKHKGMYLFLGPTGFNKI